MFRLVSALLLVSLMLIGCQPQGQNSTNPPSERPAPKESAAAVGQKYLLPQEPTSPKEVAAARKVVKDGDEVVIVGKVGGSEKPFTKGRASFQLADAGLPIEEGCDCPWDFCNVPVEERKASTVTIRFINDQGQTLPTPAQEMFSIKELSTVVVKGKVSRDDKDNVTILATGLFVRKP